MSTLVTGSSGFIGGHLVRRLASSGLVTGWDLQTPAESTTHVHATVDVRLPPPPSSWQSLVHLAARAEVAIPPGELADLVDTNIRSTLSLAQALRPGRMIFTSSSAVYGHAGERPVDVVDSALRPVGSYGMSKLAAEQLLAEWAVGAGGIVLSFRLGNVVGEHCRGLIPYLVAHARRHPDGKTPARIRSGGTMIRDYIPVATVVEVLDRARTLELAPGNARVWNLGTGLPMTNGEVADLVALELRAHGLHLPLRSDAPALAGEAGAVVLNPGETFATFGVAAPGREAVEAAIRAAVGSHLSDDGG